MYFKPDSKQTPYELWRGKKPVVKYFKIFGSDCYILCDRENLEKFDAKSDKGYFLDYSTTCRAYRVYNHQTKTINDTPLVQEKTVEVEDTLPEEYVGKHGDEDLQPLNDTISEPCTPIYETQQEQSELSSSSEQKSTSTSLVKGLFARVKLNHPATNILGSLNDNMRLRSKVLNVITHLCYLSQFEPKKVDETLQDANWINSMH